MDDCLPRTNDHSRAEYLRTRHGQTDVYARENGKQLSRARLDRLLIDKMKERQGEREKRAKKKAEYEKLKGLGTIPEASQLDSDASRTMLNMKEHNQNLRYAGSQASDAGLS